MNSDDSSSACEIHGTDQPQSLDLGVGSFFAAGDENLASTRQGLPWANGFEDPTYLQSGRQALQLLFDQLWDGGFRRAVVPAYLCESMIQPLESRDWILEFCPYDDQLRPIVTALEADLQNTASTTVVLLAEYFGRHFSELAQLTVSRLRSMGVAVIEDRTHNLLDSSSIGAEYEFGSLRKLLPVGDGCFVRGHRATESFSATGFDPGVQSWNAMDLKRDAISSDDLARSVQEYKIAEEQFASAMAPAEMSVRSYRALEKMDFAAMRASRRDNFETLKSMIPRDWVLNVDCGGGTPAFMVIKSEHPVELQRELAKRKIYCPIHWPRPELISEEIPGFENTVSVPIDHRYGPDEMGYVGSMLLEIGQHFD